MSEFWASRVVARSAVRAEEGELRPALGLGVALTALLLMATPAVIGIIVLVGRLT